MFLVLHGSTGRWAGCTTLNCLTTPTASRVHRQKRCTHKCNILRLSCRCSCLLVVVICCNPPSYGADIPDKRQEACLCLYALFVCEARWVPFGMSRAATECVTQPVNPANMACWTCSVQGRVTLCGPCVLTGKAFEPSPGSPWQCVWAKPAPRGAGLSAWCFPHPKRCAIWRLGQMLALQL